MSILSKLSKLGAVMALSASVVAFPAIAQSDGGAHKASISKHHGGKFRGHRGGNFRGHSGRNFRGNRHRGFRGNRFNGHNRGFNRRHNGFRNNGFNRGFRGNQFHHNNSFRRNNFHRGSRFGHSNRRYNRYNSYNRVSHAPVYSIGGIYNVHGGSIFISDYGSHGLYAPPHGYRWVCDKGSKDAVLAAVATGAIIAIAADILATPY